MADEPKKPRTDKELLDDALKRFRLVADTEEKQRDRELEDLRMAAGDQWPEDIVLARRGQGLGGTRPPVPARPCETFNKLLQPIQQVENQFKQARLALKFIPRGDGASQDTAEAFSDIARAIQIDSRAELARSWAFARMVRCGRGAYRILVEYSNDNTDELDIVYKRILNGASVYMDPYAQEPDWSDMRFCFICEDMPLERFREDWPEADLATADDGTLSSTGDKFPGWIKADENGNRTVRVAEYFYKEYTVTERPMGNNGSRLVRKIRKPTIKWCKLTALDILEKNEWPIPYIPIVPVIGREDNIDGERRWEGIVRPAIGAQRSYNYHRNAQMETVGLAPRAPYELDPEQIEGYEEWWLASNTRNFPYLPRKSYDQQGRAYSPIKRNVEEPAIQAITVAAREADGDVKATTGYADPSLGNVNQSDRSGKAVLAWQKQAELGSSGYLYGASHMSMVLEGKILAAMIPLVYQPGRIVSAVAGDDSRRSVMIGRPFIRDQQGQPVPAPFGHPKAQMIDLAKGRYEVVPEVGKSFTTRREEGAAAMSDLAQAAPQLLPFYADIWVGNLDFPGAKQIQDRLKKMLPPQLHDEQDGQPDMQQIQQKFQQMQQYLDVLTKELNAKNDIIETDKVKADYKLQETKIESDTRIKIAEIQLAGQLAVTDAKINAENARTFVEAMEERILAVAGADKEAATQMREHAHQAALAAIDQAHQRAQSAGDAALGIAQSASDQAHEERMASGQQAHDAQMATQQQQADQQQAAQAQAAPSE